MKNFFQRHHKLLFYTSWLFINLIQSAATDLFDDEAYYWVYSRFLDWGYFDHPPMIALLIKIGYSLFPNEFGVRLLVAILSTGALWLIEKLLNEKDDKLFYSIALSMAVLQLGGIIAAPDVPLMFFTSLFFLFYKRFVARPTTLNSIWTGICIALLLYSKYHGLLVVALTLVSNPKLLLKWQTYIVTAIALILFAPHIYWQFRHDFPSVQYHLFERSTSPYKINFTLDYIIEQLLIAGPLAGFILIWASFKRKPIDEVERALKFTTVGFYFFFLLATFRGRVEANWTFPSFIGLVALSHQQLRGNERLKRWIYRLSLITIGLVFVARLYLLGNIFPAIGLKDDEFLFNKDWANSIQQHSNGLPVFFTDSYQRASKYWFYSGFPSYSLNTLDERRNNFNLWKMEDGLQHKKTYGVYQGKHQNYFSDSINTKKGWYLGKVINDYFSFSRILISTGKIEAKSNEIVILPLTFKLDQESLKRIHPDFDTVRVWMAVSLESVDEPVVFPTDLTLKNLKSGRQVLDAKIRLVLPPKKYKARFGLTSCIANWPTVNSSLITLEVK